MTQPRPPQPSARPSWAQPSGPAAPPTPHRRANVPGLVAILLAGLIVLSGPAQQAVFNALAVAGGIDALTTVSTVSTVVRVILSLATIALGIAGLVVRDRGRILAAAALGIGASTLIGVALSALVGLVSSAL